MLAILDFLNAAVEAIIEKFIQSNRKVNCNLANLSSIKQQNIGTTMTNFFL